MVAGEAFSLEQDIPQHHWPYDIDTDYINVIKPSGLLRMWYFTPNQRSGATFDVEFKIAFISGRVEVFTDNIDTVGIQEDSLPEEDFVELSLAITDIEAIGAFDTIRYITWT